MPRLSCHASCGIFPDQESDPCLLHWQADSLPLSHREAPHYLFLKSKYRCCCKMALWVWSSVDTGPHAENPPFLPHHLKLKLNLCFVGEVWWSMPHGLTLRLICRFTVSHSLPHVLYFLLPRTTTGSGCRGMCWEGRCPHSGVALHSHWGHGHRYQEGQGPCSITG